VTSSPGANVRSAPSSTNAILPARTSNYSRRTRSAAVRIPVYSTSPKSKRLEFRPPDPSANPYLAFAALMMAGLDGIQSRIDPGLPMDVDLFELAEEALAGIAHVPARSTRRSTRWNHEFLLKGDVFSEDLIETWIAYKRKEEANEVRMRPHPWEFALYYDT
jgi:glutamine synthetase